ncbi:hypothetical protein Ddye_022909 [Dipteronia dyeriana]|uniref:Uncharacterized protein n=1 Tax=Dipteronia dyeriana TaxID=168575 RepID=A0AAD9WRW1_9ROSI|nr:hypothetical protein Ddye_022909 [Dipteronia dyeriana]
MIMCKELSLYVEEHIVGGCKNFKGCKRCPSSIQQEIREYMKNKKNEKRERNMDPMDDDFNLDLGDDDVAHNTTQQRTITYKGADNNIVTKKPRQNGLMDVYLTLDP